MPIKVAKFRDVADGLQPGQFAVGERYTIDSLDELDATYKRLLDEPVTQVLGIVGPSGRANLTPMWFDYENDMVLVNCAAHRTKTGWIRANPRLTSLLVNPANAYHWVSIKHHVARELSEDDPVDGPRVTAHLDKIWKKYTGQDGAYGLRDPSIDERRVLFECAIDQIATFGKP